MKHIASPYGILTILLLAVSCLISCPMAAQTIQIDSTFTSYGEIFPFEPYDTIYGLSISGSVNLYSEISLVRVILTDETGNEWMVYEAYPLIVADTAFQIVEECDETCFLNKFKPSSLKIQIYNSSFHVDSLNYISEGQGELDAMQFQSKLSNDLEKVQSMNLNISLKQWNWLADTTDITKMYYSSKKSLFGEYYSLLGIDYYSGGTYCNVFSDSIPAIERGQIIPSFDWREKHNADQDGSHYYDDDPDQMHNGWMSGLKGQGQCESCSAFGTLATFEAIINLYANYHFDIIEEVQFSERDAFNCSLYSSNPHLVGCYCNQGKEVIKIMNYIDDEPGIVDYECYPYVPAPGFCEGTGATCEEFSSKCDNPVVTAYSNGREPFYLSLFASQSERTEYLKKLILDNGPLTIVIGNWSTDPITGESVAHCVSLMGFIYEDGQTKWIYKNSHGYNWGNEGYGKEGFLLAPSPNPNYPTRYIENTVYAINYDPPVTIISYPNHPHYPINYEVNCRDADNDGYINWGTGGKPTRPECQSCYEDAAEDWNDDNNRIGLRDENYYGQSIQPDMKVCWYKSEWEPKTYIENNSYFSFDESELSSLNDNIFIFRIENPGNAQLNLSPINPITSNNPDLYLPLMENLDIAICMFDGYTEFSVQFLGELIPDQIGVIYIDVAEEDEDVLPDFTFYMIYHECSIAAGEELISTNSTWEGYHIKTKDYRIEDGATLTVTGIIAMVEESDIFVEPGAKIIIDGGGLTGICNKLWNGIDLWGDPLQSQIERNQGSARIINGGCIEYAKKGIETAYFDGYAYHRSGGIVYCDSAYFKDNQIGIKFYPYYYSPPGGVPVPNLSRIKNTEFEITDNFYTLDYTPALEPLHQVNIHEIWGLNILGCNFINSADNSHSIRGNGIYSMNGGYFVARRCTDLIPQEPCSNYEICTFQNLDYGIYALSDGIEWIGDIDSALFSGNFGGIFMSAINDPIITRCTFDCSDESDRFASSEEIYGLYLDNCKRYQVEENAFSSSFGSSGQEAVGLHILNSGPFYNEIYNNSFSDFHTGITAAGDNRDEYGTGLCLKCNDFTSCAFDISVTPQGGRQESYLGIAEKQGEEAPPGNPDPTYAAGNTFSQDNGTNPNYTNEEGCNPIIYTHHGFNSSGDKIIPEPYDPPFPSIQITLNPDGNVEYTEKDIACPSHLDGGIVIENEKSTIILKTDLIGSVEDTLSELVDGGETEGLDFEIQTSFPDEALQLQQSLLEDSPYLSDTILKSSIARENVLLNAMIRDILVANPQAAKTPAIMDRLENRFDPMPDYMMEEIMEGQNVYGAKEILEQHLTSHKMARDLSLSKVIRYYKTDTTNYDASMDSLEAVLVNENYPSAYYELSFLFLIQGDSIQAFNTLESIPEDFDLSANEEVLHSQFEILFNILWSIQSDTLDLDSTQIEQLNDIYLSNSIPGVYARNLLIDKQLIFYNEPVYLPDLYKNKPVNRKHAIKGVIEKTYLKVYPNPSGNFFIVEYTLENNALHSFIELSDLQGRVLNKRDLKDKQNQIIVSTEDLTAGIYILRLFTNGYMKESLKVTVTK